MQLIDWEFNSNKLTHETQLFLETTCEKDPRRFEKIQKANRLWIDFRLQASGPLSPFTMGDKTASDDPSVSFT